jgi:hypothetical protein
MNNDNKLFNKILYIAHKYNKDFILNNNFGIMYKKHGRELCFMYFDCIRIISYSGLYYHTCYEQNLNDIKTRLELVIEGINPSYG